MAAEVLRLDPGSVDADCDTSGTDAILAGNAGGDSRENGEPSADADATKKKGHHSHQHHHHRRKPSKKKRKWKPYAKMTWEEKKAAGEREQLRADRIRGEMLDRGRPVAPYNTTQFIMAEHDPYEEDDIYEDKKTDEGNADASSSKSSTSGAYSAQLNVVDSPQNDDELLNYIDSPHMAPEFISQDFSEAYERIQVESLSTMSRHMLVQEHLSLERTLSYLQDRLAEVKTVNNSFSIRVQDIEKQLIVLKSDNKRLVRENMCLKYGEEHVKQKEAEMAAESYFGASDCEYEPPNEDSDKSPDRPMEFTESFDKANGKPPASEDMYVSSTSTEPGQGTGERDKCYEADNASSENEDPGSQGGLKKRRRSQKTRNKEQKLRKAEVADSESSVCDKNTKTQNGGQNSKDLTRGEPVCTIASEPGGEMWKKSAAVDFMEAAPYSGEERNTATMDSVSSDNHI